MGRFLIPILFAALLQGQTNVWSVRRERYPDLNRIVELAQNSPPEFAAAALLRVAESAQLQDPIWRKELIAEAFERATASPFAFRQNIVAGQPPQGSREELMALQAYPLGLDRLTLSTRAIRDMFPLDQQKAREMFQHLFAPQLPPLTCADALVPDVAPYYEALGTIAVSAFRREERKHEDHVVFLSSRLGAIRSAVEIAPAANMLERISPALNNEQLKLLTAVLASTMEKISGDERSFSQSLAAIDAAVPSLIAAARFRQANGDTLATAYRGFLVHNLAGKRCGETNDSLMLRAVDHFNSTVSAPGNTNLGAISAGETKPASIGETAKMQLIFDSSVQQELRLKFLGLMTGQFQSESVRRDVEAMKPAPGESDAVFFYRKGGMLGAVVAIAPAGEDRAKAVAEFIGFVKSSNLQQQSFIEWFGQVKATADAVPGGLLETFAASGHPALLLYSALEQTLPERPAWAGSQQDSN